MTEKAWQCERCGRTRHTPEPCCYCHGTPNPLRQQCRTCHSFKAGFCTRINDEVKPWWTGCCLHTTLKPLQEGTPK